MQSGLERETIKGTLAIIEEFLEAQKFADNPSSPRKVGMALQQSEIPLYAGQGRILTSKKSKDSRDGVEYNLKKDGELVVTQKRLLVADEGTTAIQHKDIQDVGLDLEKRRIFIKINGVKKLTILETFDAILIFKLLQKMLVANGEAA